MIELTNPKTHQKSEVPFLKNKTGQQFQKLISKLFLLNTQICHQPNHHPQRTITKWPHLQEAEPDTLERKLPCFLQDIGFECRCASVGRSDFTTYTRTVTHFTPPNTRAHNLVIASVLPNQPGYPLFNGTEQRNLIVCHHIAQCLRIKTRELQ